MNEYAHRAMPSSWVWHQDITPLAAYEATLKNGEIVRGKFYGDERMSTFQTGLTGEYRIIRLHDIASIQRVGV